MHFWRDNIFLFSHLFDFFNIKRILDFLVFSGKYKFFWLFLIFFGKINNYYFLLKYYFIIYY